MNSLLNNSLISSGSYRVGYKPAYPGGNTFYTLGQVDAENGITERISKGEETYQSSNFGPKTVIDLAYQGQERFLSMSLMEYRRQYVQFMLNDYTSGDETRGMEVENRQFDVGTPGRLASSYAGSICLVPQYANLPHRNVTSNSNTSIVYHCVVVSNSDDIELAMNSKLLVVPVVLRLLPALVPGSSNTSRMTFGYFTNNISFSEDTI
jgi:hypothetical protein